MTALMRFLSRFGIVTVILFVVLPQPARGQQSTPPATSAKRPTVLFICPHGAGKSVLA